MDIPFHCCPVNSTSSYRIPGQARHKFFDPVSSKLLKPLDSGLRRNDGEVLSIFMSPTLLGILRLKHYANYSKTKLS